MVQPFIKSNKSAYILLQFLFVMVDHKDIAAS